MTQKYVAGSNVPGFFYGQDFYPDPESPDDTDLSSISGLRHIQFRRGDKGPIRTVEGSVVSRTISRTSHSGLLVSAVNMAATLNVADVWNWRFQVDLAGDSKPCYSEWKELIVYE